MFHFRLIPLDRITYDESNPMSHLPLIYVPFFSGCGGNFHGNQGTIASDNFPSGQYTGNTECVWTITVETGYHVILTFNPTFDVRSGDSVKVNTPAVHYTRYS